METCSDSVRAPGSMFSMDQRIWCHRRGSTGPSADWLQNWKQHWSKSRGMKRCGSVVEGMKPCLVTWSAHDVFVIRSWGQLLNAKFVPEDNRIGMPQLYHSTPKNLTLVSPKQKRLILQHWVSVNCWQDASRHGVSSDCLVFDAKGLRILKGRLFPSLQLFFFCPLQPVSLRCVRYSVMVSSPCT